MRVGTRFRAILTGFSSSPKSASRWFSQEVSNLG